MSEEWGPWVEHDGKGCPCAGKIVRVKYGDGYLETGIAGSRGGQAWDWRLVNWENAVVCYRIRKPRALIELRDMIADLPAPTERVDA